MTTAATYSTTLPAPLALTVWATDEGPKINVPEPNAGRGRGAAGRGAGARGAAGAAGTPDDAPDAGPAGRGRGRGGAGFTPRPPLELVWSVMRGPGVVKFDPLKPPINKDEGGKATTTATFTVPGDYLLRLQSNDQTGDGGGGFQCCWSNAYVKVTVKSAGTGG
jgi:hypothetical protein